jgi:hypothetical protein
MTFAFPKPEKPARGSMACKRHMAAVAELPCVICGARPVQVHHCISGRYAQRRASDFDTIPLCRGCHDELHADKGRWEREHGEDRDYLPKVRAQLQGRTS